MGLLLAFKAFFKALKQPKEAEKFLLPIPEKKEELKDYSHLRLLSLLQESGRLIDFLKEDITSYSDAQIGAAVRKIHQDCGKSIEEWVTIRPLLEEKEDSMITIPKGYDPSSIKIVGKVKGEAPYTGTVVHTGWKAHKKSLPKSTGSQNHEIIAPAEVEVR